MLLRTIRFVTLAIVLVGGLAPLRASGQALPRARVRLPEGAAKLEIPFELYRRWMLVPVSVEGSRTLAFILDTGAPITVLASLELGQSMPLTIIGEALLEGAGDGPGAKVAVAGDVHMTMGTLDITGAPMAVGLRSDAIGGAIFDNLVVEIDWLTRSLMVHDPDGYRYEGGGSVLPLTKLPSGHLMTTAQISVAGEPGVPVALVVDTGAGHALSIEIDTIDGLRLPDKLLEDLVIGWGSNGVVRGDIGRVATLELGDLRLSQVVTSFPDNSPWSSIGDNNGTTLQGNLGAQALHRFRVIFDVPHGRLILEPNDVFDEPFGFDHAGLALTPWAPHTGTVIVADVVADSPAAEAGIERGDQITSIGDVAVSGLSTDEVRDLLEGRPGDTLRLTLQRGGNTLKRMLTLRPLI